MKMKVQRTLLLLLAVFCLSLTGKAQPARQNIHSGWEFRQVRGHNWYPATVPGVVHTDLMANGIIEDPFFRLNERGVQWVDKEDWAYRVVFDAAPGVFGSDNVSMVFEGLDTYAEVTLNGEKIITADNMFCEWEAGVKEILKAEGNLLEVVFLSPIKVAMPMWEATPWREIIESGNDQSANGGVFNRRLGVFVRKAGYHFGWDWGPRLVTSGIWRPVYLKAWNDAAINDVYYAQTSVDEKRAVVDVTVEVVADKDIRAAEISVVNETDGRREARRTVALKKGLNVVPLTFTVLNPRLWWTNGLGKQHLYDFTTSVKVKGKTVDSRGQKLGLRSVRVVAEPDQWGESFYVELNGVPVFMKGANYIPCDSFLPRVTEEIYEKTVRDAAAANMNMLRVWGGGIYENKVFYDLCDRYGILVWQDFMFSCALYPAEGELMESIKKEAVQNVRRLRNHTCLALWCGNNECLDMWFHWGVKRRYDRTNPEWSAIQWRQFTDLYYDVLPAIVAEHQPGICYRKSSPYSDDQGMRSDSIGDYHDWDVWGQALEFDRYNHKKSRFFSEYGFQGFPSFESVQRFAPEERDWAATSEVMLSHQRAGTNGNQKIDKMMRRDYGEPRDFASFTYMSQLMQADAMKMAMEAHRRQMPRCMGSLIWQLNDCWPVASWSGRDYYGNWKAQHYAVRRAFEDVLISMGPDGIYVINDRLEPVGYRYISIECLGLRKNRIWSGGSLAVFDGPAYVAPNTNRLVWRMNYDKILERFESFNGVIYGKEDMVIRIKLHTDNGEIFENYYFPAKHKDMNYPVPYIQMDFVGVTDGETGTCGGYDVTVWSDVFARGVCLTVNGIDDYSLTDNFFDLMPGERKTVRVLLNESVYEIENQMHVTSLAEARK